MNKLTVLLVAKSDEAFNDLRRECGLAGYDVFTANHGNDALQIMSMNRVDAVICEAELPEMDGYHLCYKIRKSEKLKGTPVIIRAEEGTPEETRMASEMGADIFITKVSNPRAIAGYVYDMFNRPGKYSGRMTPVSVATESMHRYHEQLIGRLEERNKELLKTKVELEKTVQLLSESQQIAHMGSWELNLQTFECNWSDEIYGITGAVKGEIKPSPDAFLSFVHPEDYIRVKQVIEDSIAGGKPSSFNCRLVRRDGQVRHIYTYAAYSFNGQGKAIRTYGITHDITEKKLAEQEVITLNADLEARVEQRTAELLDANQQLESFAYSVSHDLRAPLRSIHSFAQLINRKYSPQLEQDGKELIQLICDSSSKMGALIENLLSFSGLGKKKIEKIDIDMNELVEKTWGHITERIEHKPAILIHSLPHIIGDKPMITQVLVNYLSNAIKYSAKTENPAIEVGTEVADKEMVFFVKDNGAGFDMAHYDKLFNVFQRLHSINEFDGTGVGLAIVKRIIDKHNGRVWAESAPGKGAKFYFALPVNN